MLQVITVDKSETETNNKLWKDLLINAYNYTYKNNDFSEEITDNNLETFWNYLHTDTVQIVLRQNKFIGFFFNKINSINKEITFFLFIYSQACPMSSRSLIKCAVIRSLLISFKNKKDINKLEFFTWHPSLIHVARNIIPITTHMITSDYIVCYLPFDNLLEDLTKNKLKLYLGVEDYHTIDIDNFKVFY